MHTGIPFPNCAIGKNQTNSVGLELNALNQGAISIGRGGGGRNTIKKNAEICS
jgi:hypothetical protein